MERGKPVHTRLLEMNTYALGDNRVLVEGKLVDTRNPHPEEDQDGSGPRLIHDLVARIWVQGPDLTVSAVEAEMPHIPRQDCLTVLPWVKKLIGVRIISGYSQKVKDLIGDVKGCSHLTHLFISLGPAAVQGYWAAYGRSTGYAEDNPALSRLVESCYVWRRNGPLFRSRVRGAGRVKGELKCSGG